MNGFDETQNNAGNPPTQPAAAAPPKVDYKLLMDPCLVKVPQKVYRYNGIVPNEQNHPPIIPKDPRNLKAIRIRLRPEPIQLIVPRWAMIHYKKIPIFLIPIKKKTNG